MTDYLGRQLGDYRLIELIGSGGMGSVYRAEHVLLEKSYALKVLPAELSDDDGFVARFRDEARVMAELRHPGIVEVHTMGCQDGIYYLVMDCVVGPQNVPMSLRDHLHGLPDGRLAEEQVAAWALQVADALAYAHQRGVVHRDIKPGNILIEAEGRVCLTDFGLAKAIGNEFILSQVHQSLQNSLSDERTRASGSSQDADRALDVVGGAAGGKEGSGILGTYDYMAPEQRGQLDAGIDPRTDVYAMGVLLYRMLTGRIPGRFAKMPSTIVEGLSNRWDAIILRCLQESPDDRYADITALAAEMREGVALTEPVAEAIDDSVAMAEVAPPPLPPPVAVPHGGMMVDSSLNLILEKTAKQLKAVRPGCGLLFAFMLGCWLILPLVVRIFAPIGSQAAFSSILLGVIGGLVLAYVIRNARERKVADIAFATFCQCFPAGSRERGIATRLLLEGGEYPRARHLMLRRVRKLKQDEAELGSSK